MDGFEIDLKLETGRRPVFHNQGTGYMEIGLTGGSYYYSRPGMSIDGTLTLDGVATPVTGDAWMDHQWGDFVLIDGGGWDWFSVQLDDGSSIMVFQLRGIEGVGDVPDFGTLVTRGGEVIHLDEDEYQIESRETWTSDETDATYPVSWTLTVPAYDIRLDLEPAMRNQELNTIATTGTIYWEGEMEVAGESSGRPVTGLGYVELTGYADADLFNPQSAP